MEKKPHESVQSKHHSYSVGPDVLCFFSKTTVSDITAYDRAWLSKHLAVNALHRSHPGFFKCGRLIKKSKYIPVKLQPFSACTSNSNYIFYLTGVLTGLAPDKLVTSVIILEIAMPCMATVVIMAKEFGSDDRLAVANVFVSTILSIITLPFIVLVLDKLFA
jgi:hypothetical protein